MRSSLFTALALCAVTSTASAQTSSSSPPPSSSSPATQPTSSAPPAAQQPSTAPAPSSSSAPALSASAAPAPRATLTHDPLATAPFRQNIVVAVDIRHAESIAGADCVYRISGGPWHAARFLRSGTRGWIAEIPALPIETRSLEYYIVFVMPDGTRTPVFASPEDPHPVLLRPSDAEAMELRELADAYGNRSEFALTGGYVDFGMARANTQAGGALQTCPSPVMVGGQPYCPDWYYSLELTYRYRFFGVIRSVDFGAGHMRGATPAPVIGSWVGLDYGFGDLELRLVPALTLNLRAILGATATTVQPGGGFGFDVIPNHAMRLTFRWQGMIGVGHQISGWMRWTTVPHVPMGAGIEVTNFPAANGAWAARLLAEIGVRIGRHFTAFVQGGYEARTLTSGGLSLGGRMSVEF